MSVFELPFLCLIENQMQRERKKKVKGWKTFKNQNGKKWTKWKESVFSFVIQLMIAFQALNTSSRSFILMLESHLPYLFPVAP